METTTDTKNIITLFDILSYQTLFFDIATTISCVFLTAMNESLHPILIKICMAVWNMVCLSCSCCHHWNVPPPHLTVLISTVWFSINVHQASMNINKCIFFLVEEFNDTPLLHVHFHVRWWHLPYSAAFCYMATKCSNSGGKVQLLLPYYHRLPLMLWANLSRRHYFRTSLVNVGCISPFLWAVQVMQIFSFFQSMICDT